MQEDLTPATLTEAVLKQMAGTENARLAEVMGSLVRHLHAFAREVKLTPAEWLDAIGFLTRTGQKCTAFRQEFILLSDVLGLSAMVNLLHDETAVEQGTESSLLGPFYRQDAPNYALGDSIAVHAKGPELVVHGRVRDQLGAPVPNASVQIWQTDSDGSYDLQVGDGSHVDTRGNFMSDGEGRFHFRTIRPLAYPIPLDGPVGELLRAQDRAGYRPAHIHFLIGAPGYRELVTALFLADDGHIDNDTVFGVSRALVVMPRIDDRASPVAGIPAIAYDFTLGRAAEGETGRVGADPSQIMAAQAAQ